MDELNEHAASTTLYHLTSKEAASAIIDTGFASEEVWLSPWPRAVSGAQASPALLEVILPVPMREIERFKHVVQYESIDEDESDGEDELPTCDWYSFPIDEFNKIGCRIRLIVGQERSELME